MLWVLCILVGLVLVGCGTSSPPASSLPSQMSPAPSPATEQSSTDSSPDTLRLLSWQAPTVLNPHLARGSKDYLASRIAYEPLASYDRDTNLVPFLAAEIPSLENGGVASDGLSVTWKLRQDVQWSDGQPFTADDVLFTYELIANPETAATSRAQYEAVERVEVVDDYTVVVHFREPTPSWSLPFVGPRGMIIPRHLFEAYNGENIREAPGNQEPVGTGPYRVVSFVPGDTVLYEPNPFFREAVFFDAVELKGGGDATSAARAVLQTGDADFAENLQVEAAVLSSLQESGESGEIVTISKPLVEHILLNRTDPDTATEDGERSSLEFPHPFFSNEQVRQAFAMAVDRETIAEELYGPSGRPASNILVEPNVYRSPNTSFTYDLEQAATLLDEAGWVDSDGDGIRDKDGLTMQVLFQTSTSSLRQKTQEIIKQSLESIGVEVDLKSIDPATFFDNDPANPDTYAHFYADLQMFTIPYDSPDPTAYMQGWICDEIAQQSNDWTGNNIVRWCNPTYDRLYEQVTTEMDPEQRQELFIQMNDLLIEEVVVIPVVHRLRVAGVGTTVAGVDLTPWDESVWNIKDWTRK